jgi:hypothetical protein
LIWFWKKPLPPPPSSGRIEVFVRHCLFSAASRHKQRLVGFSHEKCHRNLLATIDRQKANLTFFLDRYPQRASLEGHFLQGQKNLIEVCEGSEAGSFLRLLDVVGSLNLSDETILYFVEDDYLHRPGWVDILLEGFTLPDVAYVTLYDHRDKYFAADYRKLRSHLFVTRSCHWRTTPSTTQTFAVRKGTLWEDLNIHRRYSKGLKVSQDHRKFCHLQRKGRRLISSIPGWATHAEPDFASPCISWGPFLYRT